MDHDAIIVGAGSAGGVLAHQLTARSDRSVLLLPAIPSANTNLPTIMVAEHCASLLY